MGWQIYHLYDLRLGAVVYGIPDDDGDPTIDGANACPPEDCGGPGGYQALLEVLADPTHEEHVSMADWAGSFDPLVFDPAQATACDAGREARRTRPRSSPPWLPRRP